MRNHARSPLIGGTLVLVSVLAVTLGVLAPAGLGVTPPVAPFVHDANMNIWNAVYGQGGIEYGFEALVQAEGDWGSGGPVAADVGVSVVTPSGILELDVDSIEVLEFDDPVWRFAAGGLFEGEPILGEYSVTVTDGTGATSRVVGPLEGIPEGTPEMVYPTHGLVITDTTPDFEWDPFQSEYLGEFVVPWSYELQLSVLEEEFWAFPLDGSQTTLAFDDPAWEPEALTALEPGVYSAVLHSNHEVAEGFNFEHHSGIVFVVRGDGFVTGGGWFDSPAGAYLPDEDLVGRANFGFSAKYKRNDTTPSGNTEFQFKAGSVNFHSDAYDVLVVAGDSAWFEGSGTINGSGNYGFFLAMTDGPVDTLEMAIWDESTGDFVYHNEGGTALGGGNIKVHRK